MNCEWVKTNGTLFLYDELADDERHELEMHTARCANCAQELEALRRLQAALTAGAPVVEPPANLLASSRMKLQEALETAEPSRGWSRWTMDMAGWLQQIKLAPALTAALLLMGFAGGALATFSTQRNGTLPFANGTQASSVDSASIASIRGISQQPQSNTIDIQYDRLVPASAQGTVDDPRIQQLLLYAARSNYNTGVRLDSIDVLTQNPGDDRIREALIFALRYDKNPGVRLKALEGLKPYVKSDVRVRDVMLEALLRDSNPGVRSEAIRSLEPVTADSSVRQTLRALAAQDSSKYIRSESKRVLASLPEIQ